MSQLDEHPSQTSALRFVGRSELIRESARAINGDRMGGNSGDIRISASAALLLQQPMRLRSSVLSQILRSYALSAVAARLAADVQPQPRAHAGSDIVEQRQHGAPSHSSRSDLVHQWPVAEDEPEPEPEPEVSVDIGVEVEERAWTGEVERTK